MEKQEKVEPQASKSTSAESTGTTAAAKDRDSEAATSIRVPVALLDNLMTLMGEMVLVRNQVLQYSNQSEDLEFLNMSKRLNIVTSEIQGEMMKTRMQPLGNVFSKFSRVVRDLSHELNKQVHLNVSGAETELDKSILEAIKDPLTHIVRNSCDHGIEMPEARRAAGKPEAGTINLKAYHEGGQVIVEVSDDGKGLHKDVILSKAIDKGLVSQADAAKLSESDIFNLIFAPGFSTAAAITNVSGRGVGMDVVRTNIEKIGGTVELSSQKGNGTNIKIKIPLTLAIIPALIVKCGNGTFAIPQVKLEELVRVDQASSEHKIERLHGAPVLRLRGNILPLVDLNKVLNTGGNTNYKDGIINIAVLNGERASFGLIIDEVQDTADIVVKPLNRLMKALQVYAGATVLGNGAVALILDVLGISKIAQVGQEKSKATEMKTDNGKGADERQDYLVVKVNSPTKHAIVLGYVHRLEEFNRSNIEYSGKLPVIRYRDSILPLVSANTQLEYKENGVKQNDKVPVVVIQKQGTLYGIEVEGIIDTLSSAADIDTAHTTNPAIFGSLNTSEELIVVIDPFEVIRRAFPEESEKTEPMNSVAPFTSTNRPLVKGSSSSVGVKRVLVAEDTIFFRRALKLILEKTGYQVTTANDGKEAFDILNSSDVPFDLLISDIEMPKMNGFELAQAVRKMAKYSELPMLAVSSRAEASCVEKGMEAGFNAYMEKLKPQMLVDMVGDLLSERQRAA